MNNKLLNYLIDESEEEKEYLKTQTINKDIYSDSDEFVINKDKLLEKGKLITVRKHNRYAHFPKHSHDYIEMFYMVKGESTHILNDTDVITMHEGELLIMNQNCTQEILQGTKEDVAVNFIVLPPFFDQSIPFLEDDNVLRRFLISSITGKLSSISYLVFQVGDAIPIQNLLENMIWNMWKSDMPTNKINQLSMGLLLMNLSNYSESLNLQPDYEQNLLFTIMQYIEIHYVDGSLKELSLKLNQPDYYLSRLLKKETGCTFKQLLQEKKLKQAAYLLSNTTLTVEAILSKIGYNNSSYFYNQFFDLYNMSPKQYRDSMNTLKEKAE
ncbi:MAG: helix-turn-helix transcriptional regulator [Holdemanella sp.]|nr:helix-turn-helix transcriptional regulator [Holdemanella sp.]